MPFISEAQRRFMHARHPEIAKRWEKETPSGPLPEHHNKKMRSEAMKRAVRNVPRMHKEH